MNRKKTFRLNLLENAYDYLNCSLEFVVRAKKLDSQKEWKFAIIHLAHCIELLLKERLRREHKLLIYADLDKYKPITREKKTVAWDALVARIKFILGHDFDEIDAGRLDLVRGLRNQMIHYDVELHFPGIYHDYANLWNFVREFSEKMLGETLHEKIALKLRAEEQTLGILFAEEIVHFNGIFMPKELREAILEEQTRTCLTIDGQQYQRIRYGDPKEYDDHDIATPPYFTRPCHDCFVVQGQIHLLDCDMERCPKCGNQLLTCGCAAAYCNEQNS
jgi:hypothetical protein